MVKFKFFPVFFVLWILFSGCSGEKLPSDLPKLFPCSIKVVLEDGSPVSDAAVQLVPEDSQNAKWSAGGSTNTEGILEVYTIGKYQGIPQGKYKVLIRKMKEIEDGEYQNEKGETEKLYKGVPVLDPVFSKEKTTPLSLNVDSGKMELSIFTVKLAK